MNINTQYETQFLLTTLDYKLMQQNLPRKLNLNFLKNSHV